MKFELNRFFLVIEKFNKETLNEMLEKCSLHKVTVKMSTLKNTHPSYSKKSYNNLHFEMFSPLCIQEPKLLKRYLAKTLRAQISLK